MHLSSILGTFVAVNIIPVYHVHAVSASSCLDCGDNFPEEYISTHLLTPRAIMDSLSHSYAPENVVCPATRPTIRLATGLSSNESQWLEIRKKNVLDPLQSLLLRLNITAFDVPAFMKTASTNASAFPTIGISVSGGGYRALMNGAGALAAFDSRTPDSTSPGQLGGLLQSSVYVAGLSGGGWLLGSLYVNNFTSVASILSAGKESSMWQFQDSILQGPDSGLANALKYWGDLVNQTAAKIAAGHDATITDYWGRALSYQLVNAPNGGPSITWSSIALDEKFAAGEIPMPLLVADERAPNTQIISLNSTVFEISPFELGSWDPTTYGFSPLRYIGSSFSNGVLPTDQACVRGLDNAGYIMGTSSSLFNQFLLRVDTVAGIPDEVKKIVTKILKELSDDEVDIAKYTPNPFYMWNTKSNRNSGSKTLTLVDGGEDGQNIPLNPLIQPPRNVDVIFAVDSSADSNNWPTGHSLVATYRRSLNATIENGTSFPSIPDENTFINLGLNLRPTFFGCDPHNLTSQAPLIVYLPNAPYTYHSNVSTFDLAYSNTKRNAIIQNGYNVATMGNGSVETGWSTCVGCAIISRSLYRQGVSAPKACEDCFKKFCWNGSLNSTAPTSYQPKYILTPVSVSGATGFAASEDFRRLVLCLLVAFVVGW